MKHLPFLNGQYSVAPALQAVKKLEDDASKKVFDIDENYLQYIQNKQACRDEDINKYYIEKNLFKETVVSANKLIVEHLLLEYPEQFSLQIEGENYFFTNSRKQEKLYWKADWVQIYNSEYVTLFDALASQVQEDLAICQLEDDKDWLATLHICSPNYWSPAEKVGRSFDKVHTIVPGMEKQMPNYFKMLSTIVNKGPFIRFAWGVTTDDRLNHHPVPAPHADELIWRGRKIEEGCELFCRVEKQTLLGLPANEAFLFAIRTYFYPINEFTRQEKQALLQAVDTMSEQSLAYKGLTGKVDLLKHMVGDEEMLPV